MTKVARIFEDEKQQALAKVEEEKKLALAKAEEEKKLVLAKAEEALAKAEEENKLNLTREKRESVIKMLKKNYPSEEIASIISGFTLDEINAMRREMGAVQ